MYRLVTSGVTEFHQKRMYTHTHARGVSITPDSVSGHLQCVCVWFKVVMLRCVLLNTVRAGSAVHVRNSPPCFCHIAVRKFANVPNPTGEEDEVQFGDYSRTFSSRMIFRKTSAEQRDAKHIDAEVEQDEPYHFRFRTKHRKSNTPYWYLLQCKKLLKKDKVSERL